MLESNDPSDIGAETLLKAVLQYDRYLEEQSKHGDENT